MAKTIGQAKKRLLQSYQRVAMRLNTDLSRNYQLAKLDVLRLASH